MHTRHRMSIASMIVWSGLLAMAGLTCAFMHSGIEWVDNVTDPEGVEAQHRFENMLHETAYANMLTQDALRDQIGMTQTQVAAILTARAAAPPPQAQSSAADVPAIIRIEFPDTVRADNSLVAGTIRVIDAGHNVNLVSIQTLQGAFPSGSWDPGDSVSWAGDSGSIPFQANCNSAQYVRARFSLQDTAGNRSAPVDLEFYCV